LTIVVPLTSDERLAHPTLSIRLAPNPDNGLRVVSYALANRVTVATLKRVRATAFSIALEELFAIRSRIAEAIGLTV
jgi:mRNA interferase MazF